MMTDQQLTQRLEAVNWKDLEHVRQAAKQDPEVFKFIYQKVEEQNDRDVETMARSITDPTMAKIFGDLRRDGVAVWPGLYNDPQFLESARKFVKEVTADVKASISSRKDSQVVKNGYLYGVSEPVEKPANLGVPVYGRTRAQWSSRDMANGHPTMKVVAQDPRIMSILGAYSGRPPAEILVIAEELVPSFAGQEWHLDKWYEQIKAMILLTDCTMKNGPLRLVKGSHRNRSKRIWKMMHDCYAFDPSYCCTSDTAIEEDKCEVFWGTGKAGDCILFDATTLHAGTRCMEGERLDYVYYAISDSLKSQTLLAMLGTGGKS